MYHKTDALKKHQRVILKTFNRENYEELKFKQRVKKKTVPKKEKKIGSTTCRIIIGYFKCLHSTHCIQT